jgi:hypothetical protein
MFITTRGKQTALLLLWPTGAHRNSMPMIRSLSGNGEANRPSTTKYNFQSLPLCG